MEAPQSLTPTFNSQPATLNYTASLIARRVNNVEHHGKEKIANQNRQRRVHYRFSCRSTDADCAFPRGQPFMTTDEHDEYSETECFRDTHDNVTVAGPAH